MPKNLKPVPPPEFLVPADLPPLNFVEPNEERRRDGVKSTNVIRMSNFGLLITRYAPHQAIRNGDDDRVVEVKVDKRTGENKDSTYLQLRTLWLEHLPNNFTQANREVSAIVDATHQRWMAMTENSARFTMVTRSRLIVGLGGKGALEFGITLHPVTGLPYIPGSALKGLCRNYKLLEIAAKRGISPLPPAQSGEAKKQKSELDKLDNLLSDNANEDEDAKMYRAIFGTQGNAGGYIFFDAMLRPLEQGQALFEFDVMTRHFDDYYSHKGDAGHPPHDADKPIPVTFITVPAGITFSCAVGLRRNASDAYAKDVTDTLQKALAEMGIGAKTAAGYGVFWSFERIKVGIEVGDEIAGEVFDTSNGIWFTPDAEFAGEREYEAQIPPRAIQKRRNESDRVKARVVEVRDGNPAVLICEQIVEGKKK